VGYPGRRNLQRGEYLVETERGKRGTATETEHGGIQGYVKG
jgi:hypothetical protein